MNLRKTMLATVMATSLAATSASAGAARATTGGGSGDGEIIGIALLVGLIGYMFYATSRNGEDDGNADVSTRAQTGGDTSNRRDRGKVLMKF